MPQELSEVVLIMISSTLIILLLISLIVFALFVSQKRKLRYQQELTVMKHNYEQEVLKTQLETQLQTFETISRELHDNVGLLISMAMVHLNSGGSGQVNHWKETNNLLDEAMDTLRDIARSINPDSIRERGLQQSIANELSRLKRTRRFQTEFTCRGSEFGIEPEKQIIFFRIAQEALNNVIKHSGGDAISVSLAFDKPHIELSIRDNGHGFEYPASKDSFRDKSGLPNMKKRAQMIRADLTIRSEANKGTCVMLSYPREGAQNIP
jgi:signal transduction histidine kinase